MLKGLVHNDDICLIHLTTTLAMLSVINNTIYWTFRRTMGLQDQCLVFHDLKEFRTTVKTFLLRIWAKYQHLWLKDMIMISI